MPEADDIVYRAGRKLRDSSDINPKDVPLADIVVREGRRDLDQAAIKRLIESIQEVGLLSPITVRPQAEGKGVRWVLVTGRHRLEAYRALDEQFPEDGWNYIPAKIRYSVDDIDARLCEIAENLHRAELTKLERAEQIEEWRRLRAEKSGKGGEFPHPSPPNGQPHDHGISATARELGVDRKDVRDAEKVASLTEEAKAAAIEAGFDDNQSVLLKVAAAPREKQSQVVSEIAQARALKIEQDVQNRAAREVAEILVQHVPPDALDGLKANIHAAGKISTILAALNNLAGESIMDRRFA